jgi:hypothetical protein
MLPQAEKRKPPVVHDKTKPSRKLRPGDLVCGQCGEANVSSRKFCSRCGTSLATAAVVKTPWWRKLIPHRKPKTLPAGERPGQGGNKQRRRFSIGALGRPLRGALAAALVIGALLYSTFTPIRSNVNERLGALKGQVEGIISPQYDPIHPVAIVASSQANGHPPSAAFDTFKNTYWMSLPIGAFRAVPTLIVRFDQPVNLDKVQIRNGSSDNFAGTERAKTIKLLFRNTNKAYQFAVEDTPDLKNYTIHNGHKVTTVEIDFPALNSATQGSPQLALTQITFFEKQ